MSSRFESIECYKLALEHLRDSWLTVCLWTAVWFIAGGVFLYCLIQFACVGYATMALGIASPAEETVHGLELLGFALGFGLFGAIQFYSIFGVVHQTSDDADGDWLTCGIQGILHPIKAIRAFGVLFPVCSILFLAGLVGYYMMQDTLGAFAWVIPAAVWGIVGYYLLGTVFSCFSIADDRSSSGIGAIRESLDDLKGKRIKIALPILPIALGIGICCVCSLSFLGNYYTGSLIQFRMAEHTLQLAQSTSAKESRMIRDGDASALNWQEQQRIRMALSNEIYYKSIPVFEGDLNAYIQALCDYGDSRESFEARRDKREISNIVAEYRMRPGASGKRWFFLALLLQVPVVVLIALMNTIFFQFYREPGRLLDGFDSRRKEEKSSDEIRPQNPMPHEKPAEEPEPVVKRREFVDLDAFGDLQLSLSSGNESKSASESKPETDLPQITPEPGVPLLETGSKVPELHSSDSDSSDLMEELNELDSVLPLQKKPNALAGVSQSRTSTFGSFNNTDFGVPSLKKAVKSDAVLEDVLSRAGIKPAAPVQKNAGTAAVPLLLAKTSSVKRKRQRNVEISEFDADLESTLNIYSHPDNHNSVPGEGIPLLSGDFSDNDH